MDIYNPDDVKYVLAEIDHEATYGLELLEELSVDIVLSDDDSEKFKEVSVILRKIRELTS